MPTPARFATASRLASGPPALKMSAAAFSRRSRFRIASARVLRTGFVARPDMTPDTPLAKRRYPPYDSSIGPWASSHERGRSGVIANPLSPPRDVLLIAGPRAPYLQLPD